MHLREGKLYTEEVDNSYIHIPSYMWYTGQLNNNKPHGIGKEFNSEGKLVYEGEWAEGEWKGTGKLYLSYGLGTCIGEWEHRYSCKNAKRYDSHGLLTYSGDVFVRHRRDGYLESIEISRTGKGKAFENGVLYYDGEWQDDMRSGYGKEYYSDGVLKYQGYRKIEYHNSYRAGLGKSFFPNGVIEYDGEWSDNMRHGEGIGYSEEGEVSYKGSWVDDVPKDDIYAEMQELNEEIKRNPSYYRGYLSRGHLFRKKDLLALAIKDYSSAIELWPSDDEYQKNKKGTWREFIYEESKSDAFSIRGNALLMSSKYEEAVIDFNKAIEIDPKNDWAYANRALAYMHLGILNNAKDDINKALSIDAGKPYGSSLLYYSYVGQIMVACGDYQEAIKNYTRAINGGQGYPALSVEIAKLYVELKQYEQAVEEYSFAINNKINVIECLLARAGIYEKLGKRIDAIQDYREFITLGAEEGSMVQRPKVEYAKMKIQELEN